MTKDLIIVESPNKIKSIKSYLGENYEVLATGGHLRELRKGSGLNTTNFDLKWDFIESPRNKNAKKKLMKEITDVAKKSNAIFLATDPDREGEAISWHVYDLLPDTLKQKIKRITFNEITKKAILNAIDEQHDIDFNLVESQFARRVLDRIVGYRLSSLVKNKLKGLSAGRVQSIALLFVVEREFERRKFVKEEWYQVSGIIGNDINVSLRSIPYDAKLYNYNPNVDEDIKFINQSDAQYVVDNLNEKFEVLEVEPIKVTKGNVIKPLTTDKLLQYASNLYGWSTKKTTLVAQEMFEGVKITANEYLPLITYPRTDSERLSDDFLTVAYEFVEKSYGADQVVRLDDANSSQKQKNIQDAHEAIRPIDVYLLPSNIKEKVNVDVYKLYNLIWSRTVASIMETPKFNNQTIRFINNGYKFYARYKTINSLGYLVLDLFKSTMEQLDVNPPLLKKGDLLDKKTVEVIHKETTPPPYYTEATLVSALKNAGVGRPSTYSTMATIGTERGYINKEDGKLIPTDLGINVIVELRKSFPKVISIEFTAEMEEKLDVIANGDVFWKKPLEEFVPQFEESVRNAYETIQKVQDEVFKDYKCPVCDSDLLIKNSRFKTKFLGCSNYPNCKHLEPLEKPELLDELCPLCSSQLIKRKNKKKEQYFIGCSAFPKCKYIRDDNKKQKEENTDSNQ